MITFNAQKEFAQLAEAAGTSMTSLLKQAADNATETGETAVAAIEHDQQVINHAQLRIQRNQIALRQATNILRLVRKYVS